MKRSGQNLSEYGIAFGLIAIASITLLGLIGTNVSERFTGAVRKKQPAQIATATNPLASANSSLASGNIPFPNLPGTVVQVDLGNDKILRLNYADPAAVAEAAGGNGVTENALAVLDQVIAQLRAQGEDEAKVDELEKLSQEGYRIQAVQKQIEDKLPPGGFASDSERYNFLTDPANKIRVNDEDMTLLAASSALNMEQFAQSNEELYSNEYSNSRHTGVYESFYEVLVTSKDFEYQPGPLKNFMLQLQKVQNSGLLENPVLKRIVQEDLSQQIFVSSNRAFMVPKKEEAAILSTIVRNSSNDICALSRSVTCQDRAGS